MVNLDKFDTTCILHNETYDYYCSDCRKNICQYCLDEFHNDHNLIDLDDINLKRKEIKRIKENFIKEKENKVTPFGFISKMSIIGRWLGVFFLSVFITFFVFFLEF